MITSNHATSELSKLLYFSDLGVSNSCSSGAYSACTYSKGYSYKYCFSYNIVFDGMFNIETLNSVPIQVSEQELYNPYFKPEQIMSSNICDTTKGTLEGVMYCAVK